MQTRRQFVSVQFQPGDSRSYTYHHDGDPLSEGDRVVVETKKGRSTVTVLSVGADEPHFPTKPIIGRADGAPLAMHESAQAPGSVDFAPPAF